MVPPSAMRTGQSSPPTRQNGATMKSFIGTFCIISALAITGAPAFCAANYFSHDIVVSSPSGSPALAQAGAEAMYLHDLGDGRTVLYVEDQGGRSLSILDVTNPDSIKLVGHAGIAAKGPFDFEPDVTDNGTLIRYRAGSGFGLIDFTHWKRPSIAAGPEFATATGVESIETSYLLLSSGSVMPKVARLAQSYDVVETSNLSEPRKLATIPAVTQRLLRTDTGTLFLLSPAGITAVWSRGAERRAAEAANPSN